MTAAAASFSRLRRKDSASRFIAVVIALAFLLQSFVTQTHIHSEPLGHSVNIAGLLPAMPGKLPLDHSQRDCPFCQAVFHAGAFTAPSVPSLIVPLCTVYFALLATAGAVTVTIAHNWQSRAPPSR